MRTFRHQTIGMIYHFWVENQEVLRPFSIRAQEPLLKNERSINAHFLTYYGQERKYKYLGRDHSTEYSITLI